MREHVVNTGLGQASLWSNLKSWWSPVSGAVRHVAADPWSPNPADAAIRKTLLGRMAGQAWWHPLVSNVVVIRGAVIYQGLYYGNDDKLAARRAVQGIPGVREVRDARVRASA